MASIKFFDAHYHVWEQTKPEFTTRLLDSGGIDGLNLILARPGTADPEAANAEAYALKEKHQKRVQLACWVDPREQDYLAGLTHFLDTHPQVTGIKIHPVAQKLPITEENFGPTMDVALQRDLYVITHTEPRPGFNAMSFFDLMKQRSKLRFIVGHGSPIEEAMYMAMAFENCYVEPSWLGFFSLTFEMAERLGGYHKIMAGTDGPGWFHGFAGDPFEDIVQRARGYLPTMRQVQMFCHENAANFFRL